jgi:hypothetical protein
MDMAKGIARMDTINLAGSDGTNYAFIRHAMGKEAPKAPGLFIFTGSTEEDKTTASALHPDDPSSNHPAPLKDYPLCIEQTDSLDKELGGLLTRSAHFEAWQNVHATSAWYCVLDWPAAKRRQAMLDLRGLYPYPIIPDS